MKRSERLCIFCEQLWIDDDRGWGSTMTGPYGSKGFACKAHHFQNYDTEDIDTVEDMRKLFKQAATCEDYYQPLDNGEE